MNLFRKLKKRILIKFDFHKDPQQRIVSFWERGGADFDYYGAADNQQWLDVFWKKETLFYQWFQELQLDRVLEIACGNGRHSAQVADKINKLYLLDSSAGALELAKEKFQDHQEVYFIRSSAGIPFHTIAPASLTAIFSYDAMVHFEKETVYQYLKDSYTALQPGGSALIHHSNYDKNPDGKFTGNPGWRNYMTQALFTKQAEQLHFQIIRSQVFSFSCKDSDCLTLLKK